MKNSSNKLLFVYGTLRSDNNNEMYKLLARNAKFISDAWYKGKLYNISYYPGAIPSTEDSDKVIGEVYELFDDDLVLAKLDEYEECSEIFPEPREYIRKKVKVHLLNSSSNTVDAWIYLYTFTVDNLVQIKSGDFSKFKKP